MFSKTFGHALRATTYIATYGTDGNKVTLQELSKTLDIPHYFLGKIMQDLVRHGVLDSIKGPSGGYFINKKTLDLPLTAVLQITDGTSLFELCALGLKRCNPDRPCLLHNDFKECRDGMLKAMGEKTIRNMVEQGNDLRKLIE